MCFCVLGFFRAAWSGGVRVVAVNGVVLSRPVLSGLFHKPLRGHFVMKQPRKTYALLASPRLGYAVLVGLLTS